MIRVLVLADSSVVRAELEAMLRADVRFDPIPADISLAHVARLSAALTNIDADVVLADIDEKDFRSLSLAIGDANLPLVLLTDDVSRSELVWALRAGARAILPRHSQRTELFAAIEAAAAGLTAFSQDELELLLPFANDTEGEGEPLLEALTPREIEVLGLMAQGLANRNIAERLEISEHTVRFHVSSILGKLGATSRTDAVTKGLKNGLLII